MTTETLAFLETCIKSIPDYPKPGILFRDITSLVEHPQAFAQTIELLVEFARQSGVDKVLDYTRDEFIREDRQYDLILDRNNFV